MNQAGIMFALASRKKPVSMGCCTTTCTRITSPRWIRPGTTILVRPVSVMSATPVEGGFDPEIVGPQLAGVRLGDSPDAASPLHLDPCLQVHGTQRRGEV